MTCAIGLQRGLLSVVQPACGRTILEMSVAMKSEEEGQLRDRLARERTKLAVERTILAYIRTALAFVVVRDSGDFHVRVASYPSIGRRVDFSRHCGGGSWCLSICRREASPSRIAAIRGQWRGRVRPGTVRIVVLRPLKSRLPESDDIVEKAKRSLRERRRCHRQGTADREAMPHAAHRCRRIFYD
jgi:hypothetical protein